MNKKLLLSLLLTSSVAISALAADRVVATYGGKELKKSEIEQQLRVIFSGHLPENKNDFDDLSPQTKQSILQDLVQQKLLEDDMNSSKIKDSKLFQQQVAAAQKKVAVDLYMQNLVKRQINEAMIKAEYANFVNTLKNNPSLKIAHILVATEDEAKKAAAEIKSGKAFEEVAKEVSIDKQNKDKGGEIGYIQKGRILPDFEKIVYQMKTGEVSEPVKSKGGWHLLKVLEVKAQQIPELAQVHQQIEQQVAMKIIDQHVAEIAKKTDVKLMVEPEHK